jgi:hypothetical protein
LRRCDPPRSPPKKVPMHSRSAQKITYAHLRVRW